MYIHKYYNQIRLPFRSLFIYITSSIITFIFSIITPHAWAYNTIFNLISSIALFCFFNSLNIRFNEFINKLAKYTFGVYLIDVNEYFSRFLYRQVFNSDHYWNSNLMIVNLVYSVLSVYIICVLLESIRLKLFNKLFVNITSKFTKYVQVK